MRVSRVIKFIRCLKKKIAVLQSLCFVPRLYLILINVEVVKRKLGQREESTAASDGIIISGELPQRGIIIIVYIFLNSNDIHCFIIILIEFQ